MDIKEVVNYENSLETRLFGEAFASFDTSLSLFLATMPDDWLARRQALEKFLADYPEFTRQCVAAAAAQPVNGEPYSRKVIFSDTCGEVMVAHWSAQATCAPHDHGNARGVVLVLEGSFLEESFRMVGSSLKRLGEGGAYGEGDCVKVQPDDIHRMHAETEGFTLHFYSPQIRGMKVYDEKNGIVYTVADNCGAWIPADRGLILGEQRLCADSIHHSVP